MYVLTGCFKICPFLQEVLNGEVLDMARRLGASGMKLLVIDTGERTALGLHCLGLLRAWGRQ